MGELRPGECLPDKFEWEHIKMIMENNEFEGDFAIHVKGSIN